MGEWKPIETAPKDGTRIRLGCRKKNGEIGMSHAQYSWCERNKWFSHYEDKGFGAYPTPFKPTHWQPLPPPRLPAWENGDEGGPAYYNENDPYAAQWLRNLIAAGLIAPGEVDDRSIKDVTADDLKGFTQCHFFAGIAGWSLALRLAGWPDDRPVWTGSCPCQPFSEAGQQKGLGDERHLWPAWANLIRQCKPSDVFGEQVASAAFWFDGVFADLEEMGYAVAAAVLPACAVDAPHIRERLWFVANSERGGRRESTAHPAQEGQSLRSAVREEGALGSGSGGEAMAQPNGEGWQGQRCGLSGGRAFIARGAVSANRQWEPEPPVGRVANGIPAKSHKLRAYGNAIVPQTAAAFIGAYLAHLHTSRAA